MSDAKPKEPPTFTVEIAEGPNVDGASDQARLAHELDDTKRTTLAATLEQEKAGRTAQPAPPVVPANTEG